MTKRQTDTAPAYAGYDAYPLSAREQTEQQALLDAHRLHLPSRRTLGRIGMGLVAPAVIVAHVEQGIQQERHELSQTHPEIHHVYDAETSAVQDRMVVVMTGLGTNDASETARAESGLAQYGNVEAIAYDDKGLDDEVLAGLIEERASELGATHIILNGHSMGGRVALDVAALIHKKGELQIDAILLDCTPFDMSTVQPSDRTQALALLRLLDNPIGRHLKDSPDARIAIEMMTRKEEFIDGDGLHPVAAYQTEREVERVLQSRAKNSLYVSQLWEILAPTAPEAMKELSVPQKGKVPPKIIFVSPTDPHGDTVVNDPLSKQKFVAEGHKDGLLVVGVTLDGSGHANPGQESVRYNQMYGTTLKRLLGPEQIPLLPDDKNVTILSIPRQITTHSN